MTADLPCGRQLKLLSATWATCVQGSIQAWRAQTPATALTRDNDYVRLIAQCLLCRVWRNIALLKWSWRQYPIGLCLACLRQLRTFCEAMGVKLRDFVAESKPHWKLSADAVSE
jgi:hypothetical protein